jgi:hypothetical protein
MGATTEATTEAERREPVMVHLRPSVREEVDRRRTEAGQSRSEWLERLIVKALKDGT